MVRRGPSIQIDYTEIILDFLIVYGKMDKCHIQNKQPVDDSVEKIGFVMV
jgi:hypothetical protein